MSSDNFYKGADYGFDPEYGGTSQAYSSNLSANIGLTSDARTANQLKATSQALNTGATTVEVGAVSPDIFESIPQQHFQELNRLRKLVGGNVELTLHAPIVEPTGLTKRGWDRYEREQAERQMGDAISKAHELNPEGNVVTTFHASAISLPAETRVWEEKEGKKVPVIKEIILINERTGEIAPLPLKPSAWEGKKEVKPQEEIEKLNRANWYKNLQHVNYLAENGAQRIDNALKESQKIQDVNEKGLLQLYKYNIEGEGEKVDKAINKVSEISPTLGFEMKHALNEIGHGEIYLRDAYNNLRDLYDQAYSALDKSGKKEELEKLDKFRTEMKPFIENEKYLKDPEHLDEFKEKIRQGVHVLRSLEAPQLLKEFKDFALDKSAETFGNVAFNAFKKFGSSTPIVSIENPPAGQGILHTGEDLKRLVEKARTQFEEQAVKKMGLSENEAEKQAEKLIGVTWDVGHINMLRKFGAGTEELKEETKQIAKLAKHVHLSDNFGMEHTELPMGMGNVPKEMLEIIEKNNKKFKKIVEVGQWYQHFQTTPFPETMQHFNSPIYAMKNASYWGPSGYFSGLGSNPDIHHAMYGAGFANLPVELGGQMSGRSRISGNPLE